MSIQIGIKVRAVRDLGYLGGQTPDDKIRQGELVTVERVEGNQLYFKEHADRYGGWPDSEFIPDGMFMCPNCENALSEVYSARSVKQEWNGETWIETDVYSEGKGCLICNEDIDDDTLDTFGLKSRDKVFYSLSEDDIDQVAEELDEKLTEAEVVHVKKGIESGFGNCWHDIVESAIQDVVMSRRES